MGACWWLAFVWGGLVGVDGGGFRGGLRWWVLWWFSMVAQLKSIRKIHQRRNSKLCEVVEFEISWLTLGFFSPSFFFITTVPTPATTEPNSTLRGHDVRSTSERRLCLEPRQKLQRVQVWSFFDFVPIAITVISYGPRFGVIRQNNVVQALPCLGSFDFVVVTSYGLTDCRTVGVHLLIFLI